MKLSPKAILIMSIVSLVTMSILSYFYKDRYQTLPAVIKTDKMFISAETSGIVDHYIPVLNSQVKVGDPILKMTNPKLLSKIENHKKILSGYEELITSARNGDLLKLELLDIDDDLAKCNEEINDLELDKLENSNKLALKKIEFNIAESKYKIFENLLTDNELSSIEFKKRTSSFVKVILDYQELQRDSLRFQNKMNASLNKLQLLKENKDLLIKNVSLLAAKHIIEKEELETEISDYKTDLENLNIFSPVNGIVTDIMYKPGEKIQNGNTVVEIATMNKVWVLAYGNSKSRQRIKVGKPVVIYCNNRKKIKGKVASVSPLMEKIKSLSNTYETANTYSKIEIQFDNEKEARENLTPGERLFVKIAF